MLQFGFYVALVTSLLNHSDLLSRQHSIVDRPYARGLIQSCHSGKPNRFLNHAAWHMKAALVMDFLDCTGCHANPESSRMSPSDATCKGPDLHGRHMFS